MKARRIVTLACSALSVPLFGGNLTAKIDFLEGTSLKAARKQTCDDTRNSID